MLKSRADKPSTSRCDRTAFMQSMVNKGYRVEEPISESTQLTKNNYKQLLEHCILELMASIVLTYSAFYTPEASNDYLKQYVGAICIVSVLTTFRDSHYFFPDGTPMVTAVLWAATLYTDKTETRWWEIAVRVTGQLLGCVVVFFLVMCNQEQHAHLEPANNNTTKTANDMVHITNEGISTMLECIAIAFATIPLVAPYDDDDNDIQLNSNNLIKSKHEADPPQSDVLLIAALSMAIIHYSLERVFHTTMNPFVTVISSALKNDWSCLWVLLPQVIGVILAVAYVRAYLPSKTTIMKLKGRAIRNVVKQV